ncbi:MAG TPA: lysophospholipid acyltransferase family protein [Oligoflexia bacterium]|nr:lysophospholipid acyltransferase family protein [Oligoflexia bacterium]HMP26580.1 lysophospholipid acyltransferase family protein [Oligoflexia bacterium]
MLRALISFIRLLPLSFVSNCGWCCGWLIGQLPLSEVKVCRQQLTLVGLPARLTPRVFAHFGRIICESLFINRILSDKKFNLKLDGIDNLENFLKEARGSLFLTAHFGNWELLAAFAARSGFKLTTIARRLRKPNFQKIIEDLRLGSGIDIIWRDKSFSFTQKFDQALAVGGFAGLIDQDTNVRGVFLPFFEVAANTPSTLVNLALQRKIKIYAAFLARKSLHDYRLVIRELSKNSSDIKQILLDYNKMLEDLIREYPEQWCWFHKRWRTRPNGEKLSTRNYLDKIKRSALNLAAALSFFAIIAIFPLGCSGNPNNLKLAEEYAAKKEWSKAIRHYYAHINDRNLVKNRPDWENPYFYLIAIGDIHLEEKKYKLALDRYLEAEAKGIPQTLVTDRIRLIAAKLKDDGALKDAFEHLKKFKDRDSLIFDGLLDSLAKQITQTEEQEKQNQK